MYLVQFVLFGAVLTRRGDTVFAVDRLPQRAGMAPDGPVDAAVLCAPGGGETALARSSPVGRCCCLPTRGRCLRMGCTGAS